LETGNALRETSDALLRDLDVLVTIEEEKRSLEPGDPRLVELAERIEEIARRVLVATTRQHDLTRVVNRQVDEGSPHAPDTSIEETVRPIQAILADWRDAERRAIAAEAGSAEAAEADALVDRLREEYRRAHEAAARSH
jgi:DNA-binding HxlR family transcriptional regulator